MKRNDLFNFLTIILVVHSLALASCKSRTHTFIGDGGPAIAAQLMYPGGLTVDPKGNIFFADSENHCVRRIDVETQIITTVAGQEYYGYDGDGGPATEARLYGPSDVALDNQGNLFIAEMGNHCVRRVDVETGVITTVVGTGRPGFEGDGGPAKNARLCFVTNVTFDKEGNLFITDCWNHRIRRVDKVKGIINTVAGDGYKNGWSLNGEGRFVGDEGPATETSLNFPGGISFDRGGNLLIADAMNNRIRRVDAKTNIITTIAGCGQAGFGGDGELATKGSLNTPSDVLCGADGSLYIADYENHRIRKVDYKTGVITTVLGPEFQESQTEGTEIAYSKMHYPLRLSWYMSGDLLFAEPLANRIICLRKTGKVSLIAGNGQPMVYPSGWPVRSDN